jgi:hypothetical protein
MRHPPHEKAALAGRGFSECFVQPKEQAENSASAYSVQALRYPHEPGWRRGPNADTSREGAALAKASAATLKDRSGCPKCGSTDGFMNVGRDHWFTCEAHGAKWYIGSNLFSCWKEEDEEHWRRNLAVLAKLREVQPLPCTELQDIKPIPGVWQPAHCAYCGQTEAEVLAEGGSPLVCCVAADLGESEEDARRRAREALRFFGGPDGGDAA